MHDVRAIGNWFLDRAERSNEKLTAMKLQKLAYVAHGWYLAFFHKPLASDPVEAWKWGPVFRSLYREFREYGSSPIDSRATAFDGANLTMREINIDDYDDAESVGEFLESVWDAYGKYTAGELSNITHREGTPWYQMFEKMGCQIKPFTIIPNELIEEHYKKLLHERAQPENSAS